MNIATLTIELAANVARLSQDMQAARNTVEQNSQSIQRAARAATGALAALAAGMSISNLVAISDQYTKFVAQLKLASTSTAEFSKSMADVKRISKDAQSDLEATGVLYARIANGTRELGISQKRVADITEVVNMSLKVSGATAAESSSAMLQLSQAFASGTLRGEEFNAVNEAAPRLMKALAEGMGVPIGALKEMASNGLITSEIMANALPRALQEIKKEAAEIQTISGAFVVLKNSVMEFVGLQSQASGTVSAITKAIGLLADNLGLLAGAMLTLMAVKLSTWLAPTMRSRTSASAFANIKHFSIVCAHMHVGVKLHGGIHGIGTQKSPVQALRGWK